MTNLFNKIENTVSSVLNEDMIKDAEQQPGLPSKSTLRDNKNLIGAILGGVAAVGLEVISPTGSKTSAITAGIAAGAATYWISDIIGNAPQNTTLSVASGIVTCYVGMCAGRIAACYFPGNLED